MKRQIARLLVVSALVLVGRTAFAADPEAGFKSLFDGETLKGWDGNPELWSVEDGVITGRTTAEKPLKANSFLIWRGGEPSDFELRLEFRIEGGNSGVQFRSRELDKWVIGGYQADFDGANTWTGSLYSEKTGRGVLAKRGTKVVLPEASSPEEKVKPQVVGETTPEDEIVASVKKEDWNELVVVAKGNRIVQKLNGLLAVDVEDNDTARRSMEGLIALQVHQGPPMVVQFRNLRIKQAKP